jgi:hypothetical protein
MQKTRAKIIKDSMEIPKVLKTAQIPRCLDQEETCPDTTQPNPKIFSQIPNHSFLLSKITPLFQPRILTAKFLTLNHFRLVNLLK